MSGKSSKTGCMPGTLGASDRTMKSSQIWLVSSIGRISTPLQGWKRKYCQSEAGSSSSSKMYKPHSDEPMKCGQFFCRVSSVSPATLDRGPDPNCTKSRLANVSKCRGSVNISSNK